MAVLPSEEFGPSLAGGLPTSLPGIEALRSKRKWLGSFDVYIPAFIILFMLFMCFIWPLVYTVPPPVGGSILDAALPIGASGHFLGTDPVGNDIFSRLLYGGRVSFEVAAAVQSIGILVGSAIGIGAAFLSGIAEAVAMRIIDVFIALPAIVLALVIVDGLGASEGSVIWALSVASIPTFARFSRAGALRLRDQNFVTASSLAGSKRWRIISRHVVPNLLPQLFTFFILGAGIAIVLEATLSFFGYGIPDPNPSWGNMIALGYTVLSTQPRLIVVPSIVLIVLVIALNWLSDSLRSRWGLS